MLDTRKLFRKAQSLAEILTIPHGLQLKLSERGFFDTANFRVCLRLKDAGISPRTILDVGANAGQFALAARTVFPGCEVHSYEPTRGAYARLEALCRRHPGIHPHHLALGREAGTLPMTVTNQSQSSSLLALHDNHRQAYPEVAESGTEMVRVSTLADELRNLPGGDPVLLKLDVQGYEGPVLEGAGEALSRFRWVLLETSSQPMYAGQAVFDELQALLKARGFTFAFPLDIHLAAASGAVCQFDALFRNTAPASPA